MLEAEASKRHRQDLAILRLFAIVLGAIFLLVLIPTLLFNLALIEALGSAFAAGLAVSIYVVGAVEFVRYRRNSRMPRKKVWKILLAASGIIWAVLAIIVGVALAYPPAGVDFSFQAEGVGVFVAVLIALFLASLLSVMLLVLLAFGAVGLVSTLTRLFTPQTLAIIQGFSGKNRPTIGDNIVAWIFGIPNTLDTRSLKVNIPDRQDEFPRKRFIQAVLWELAIGTMLAIYIAFNPLLIGDSSESILSLFGELQAAAILIPLVMLPWFVFAGVDATIKGMTKDFRLYDGIKARIFPSYFAVVAIVVFVRTSLTKPDVYTYVFGFLSYLLALVIAAVLFTYVFYNYFDREVTRDVIVGYNRILAKK